MTYQDSLVQRQELFINTALLAAHSSAQAGFRVRDLSFFIDLFQSWVETSILPFTQRPQRSQLKRLTEDLLRRGFLRQLPRQKKPIFEITRPGLLEILSRLVDAQNLPKGPYFFFLYYFIKNYGQRINHLFKAEDQKLPYGYQVELERLTNVDLLLSSEIEKAQQALKKIERRILDARKTSEHMERSKRLKEPLEEAILKVQHLYPYELNHQKPLAELIASIPIEQREWELTIGNYQRINAIWEPEKEILLTYLKQLKNLK